MHELEAEYSDRIDFIFLDVDDSRTNPFKQALGYRYQPELFLLDGDGEIITHWVGFVTWEILEQGILAALESY